MNTGQDGERFEGLLLTATVDRGRQSLNTQAHQMCYCRNRDEGEKVKGVPPSVMCCAVRETGYWACNFPACLGCLYPWRLHPSSRVAITS